MGFHVIEGPARFTEFSTIYNDSVNKVSPYQYGEVRAERKVSVSSTLGSPVTTYNPITRTWIFIKAEGAIVANNAIERDVGATTVAEQYAGKQSTGLLNWALFVGVSNHIITAGYGGWVIYSGLCRCIGDGTPTKGSLITTAATGEVALLGTPAALVNTITNHAIGISMEDGGATGDLILLHLRP